MRQRVDKNSSTASTSVDREKESIVYRTRSKLSLEEIALEDIEQAFLPPDVTNDMYDPDYEIDDEWFRFCFDTYNTPVERLNAEEEDEADPDFTLFGLEESETTRRSNNSINSTLDSTILESTKSDYYQSYLFENQNNILPLGSDYQGSTLNTPIRPVPFTPTPSPAVIPKPIEIYIPQQDYCNDLGSVQQSVPAVVINTVSIEAVVPTNNSTSEEENFVGITPHQRDLISIQMSQHVQLMAQQFLMTYKHPVLHKHSVICKYNLEHLRDMADGNEDSSYNAINLTEALKLIEDWEAKLQDPLFSKMYLNIVNENIETEMDLFEKRKLHVNTFAPKLCKVILDSKALIHPVLLPRVFPKAKHTVKNDYLKSEESLIVMGLERFVTHINNTSKSLFNTKVSRRNDAIKLINQHMMPIRNFNSLLSQIKKMVSTNELVRHFFCEGNNPPKVIPAMIHVFLPIKTLVEPKCQPIDELPLEWQKFMKDYDHLDDNEVHVENIPLENCSQSLNQKPTSDSVDQPDEGYSTPENKMLLLDEYRNMPSLFCTPEKIQKVPEPEPSEDEEEGNLVVSEIKEEPVYDYYTDHDEDASFSFAEVLERRKQVTVSSDPLEIPKTSKKRKIEKSSSKSKKKSKRAAPTKTKKSKVKGKNFLIDSEFSDNEGGLPVINIENTEFSSDSNDSSVDIALKYKPWSKEEDQVLLENLRNKCFEAISSTLENRSVNEIKRRSDYLLGLIQKKHLS